MRFVSEYVSCKQVAGTFILGLFLWCAFSGSVYAAQNTYLYHILRNGHKIGEYSFVVDEQGTKKNVQASMNIRVMLGPVPLYQAKHRRTENWAHGTLVALKGYSTYNNKTYYMGLKKDGYSYSWNVNGKETLINEDVITITPWRPKGWKEGLLLTEKGKTKSIERTYLGETMLGDKPEQITTRHYKITGANERELWYNEDDTLVALKYKKDGADITFEYQQPFVGVNLPSKR